MTKQELINFGKKQVEDVIRTQLGKKKYRFLISEIEERLNHHDMVRFEARKISWDDEKTIIKKIEDNLPYNYYIPLRLEGQLILNAWSQKREEIEYVFDLNINMWFNFDEQNPLFSYDIHDKTKSLLYSYNLRVDNFLKENNLQALFQMESQFEGKNSVQFFIEIIRHNDNIPSPFSDFEMYNDIAMCHQDITFALGELFLYKPYISDFTEHSTNIGGQPIFHYFPNFTDKRYLAKCSNLFELFYNYWDKIGDILAPYLAPNLAERDIYFDRVIDRTNFNITNNNFYDWLKDFRENQYKELNQSRKQVVHYKSIENQTFQDYHNNFTEFEKLLSKQRTKEAFTEYFKNHYDLTVVGFHNALKLIESTYR